MRAYLEIDLKQLEQNYLNISNYVKKPIMAVVKSNAYGHGLVEVSHKLYSLGVNFFVVATTYEALMLRKYLPNVTILLLEPSKDFKLLYQNHITLSIGSMSYLKKVIASRLPFNFHLKLETGLNRLGITQQEEDEAISLIKKSNLHIKGVYTHLISQKEYLRQEEIFKKMLIPLKTFSNLLIHLNSSSYIYKNSYVTHYRIGLALYGLIELPQISLQPIIKLKAPIYRAKKIYKNELIGYHNNGIAPSDGYILTIPLGYADGWNKKRKTIIFYHDNYLYQVGETCMDLMMIYSKNYIDEGEIIEIISPNLDIFKLGKLYQESLYELTTTLSDRLLRIYNN